MYPGDRHIVEQIYFFGTNHPNHFEDITDNIEFKLDLLACHKSQFPDFSKVESFIREKVSRNADGYTYSEAFRRVIVEQIT